MDKEKLYRPNIGITLFNASRHVFIGERIDNPGGWQMPQGGIDENEDPHLAVFREMEEEIGTRNARIIGEMTDWLHYDFPPDVRKKLWNGKYAGQKQKWIALEFLGEDSDIRLDADDHPEFAQWKWEPLHSLMDIVVPFKREVYEQVLDAFSQYAQT